MNSFDLFGGIAAIFCGIAAIGFSVALSLALGFSVPLLIAAAALVSLIWGALTIP